MQVNNKLSFGAAFIAPESFIEKQGISLYDYAKKCQTFSSEASSFYDDEKYGTGVAIVNNIGTNDFATYLSKKRACLNHYVDIDALMSTISDADKKGHLDILK